MPTLTAVSSSANQLQRLLRCINYTSKAQVTISEAGIRFSVEESRVLQSLVFLTKDLFTSYRYDAPPATHPATQDSIDLDNHDPTFQISLSALLETLSIFGATDPSKNPSAPQNQYTSGITTARTGPTGGTAFSNAALGLSSICRITYRGLGDPLNITLEEGNVTTTCSLTTYEPDQDYEDIPFSRDRLALKIIMRSSLLYDAVQELHHTTNPERVLLTATPSHGRTSAKDTPTALSLSATGALGSASIDFAPEPQLLETFNCGTRVQQVYKFSMIRAAARAMGLASKVSVRVDDQGVLSLQFMVEMGEGGEREGEGRISFVDFRFVPFLKEEEGEEGDGDGDDGDGDSESE